MKFSFFDLTTHYPIPISDDEDKDLMMRQSFDVRFSIAGGSNADLKQLELDFIYNKTSKVIKAHIMQNLFSFSSRLARSTKLFIWRIFYPSTICGNYLCGNEYNFRHPYLKK